MVRINKLKAVWICTAAAVLMMRGVPIVHADDGTDYKAMYEEQKKRNDDLEKRVTALEGLPGMSTQNVALTKADIPQKSLDFLGQTEISGFVSASYLYDFNHANPVGRLYDIHNDQFSINKFKLALEKPIDYNPTNWNAGYRVDLIFGEDAAVIHSGNPAGSGNFNLGTDGDLEQAFVDVNIPVGNGLKVLLGKMVTCMGVEVIEEVANPNWSIGNQFIFVENTTQTGLQLQYKWTDKIDTEFCFFNGWDVLPDNNTGKSFMGRIGYAPDANDSIALVGYGGPEQNGNSSNWRDGVDVVINHKFNDKFNSYVQLDYGHEDNAFLSDTNTQANAEWYAAGLWLTYDFTDKIELAFRQDWLKDRNGSRSGFTFGLPVGVTPELYSSTLTLNYKPVANLQVRPEFRWDHSDKEAYNGIHDQFTAGIGVAYLY